MVFKWVSGRKGNGVCRFHRIGGCACRWEEDHEEALPLRSCNGSSI
jgi:hypothetical protein